MSIPRLILLSLIFSLSFLTPVEAIVKRPVDKQKTSTQVLSKKEQKRLLRKHRKQVKKALFAQARNVFQSRNFKLGLILLLGGILITLLLSSLLSWIGLLAIIGGLGLMLWALVQNVR